MTLSEHSKTTADIISVGVTVGTVLSWLPHIAALLTILWTAIRIYETPTVQRVLGKEYHRQGDIPVELEKVNKDG
jgi:peptidoglycan biosynthesis protein MviN/MurJ (putative lipid II flippase)